MQNISEETCVRYRVTSQMLKFCQSSSLWCVSKMRQTDQLEPLQQNAPKVIFEFPLEAS